MAANKSKIYVVTKNGNFVEAVTSKVKAIKRLRHFLSTDLHIKCPDAEPVEREGVLGIAGTPHYRAKHVALQ